VLRWARQLIDPTDVAAAERSGIPDNRVRAWESGEVKPTIAQLGSAARVYKRSFALCFLDASPQYFETMRGSASRRSVAFFRM
jgi:transcriptional regulator with XRE-family HTH domain